MTGRARGSCHLSGNVRFRALLFIAAVLAASVAPARAELQVGHQLPRSEDPKATPIPFTASDFLRVALTPMERTNFPLGDPVILPLRLVNHTQFKVAAVTNVNPRGSLKVTIYSEDRTKRSYNGPYETGGYVAEDILLYPFDEVPLDVTIWGDLDTPTGLAFAQPGTYLLKVELEVGARLSSVRGLIPVEPILIRIEPPSERLAPLVEKLSAARAWPELHRRTVPASIRDEIVALADEYADTPIGAFMNYAVGLEHNTIYADDPTRSASRDLALKSIAAASRVKDFPYRAESLRGLVFMHDREHDAASARAACLELIDALPPGRASVQASTPLVMKYLGNSAEMDPIAYWDLLE